MLPVSYSRSPVPLADGAGSLVVYRDISAQRAAAAARHDAEELLRRSEAPHRTLTASLPPRARRLRHRVLVAGGRSSSHSTS
jgi:hypothetical protein